MTAIAPLPLAALVEQARLAAVEQYRRLTVADLADLSRVSTAAAESLGATQAAVCFVHRSRLWFGGACGLPCRETARDASFCGEVVRRHAALLVPDGEADPRFCEHEMVRGAPGLRSYAGVPLVDGGGYTLGTVAVFSVQPARFGAAVLAELDGLATLVRNFLSERITSPRAVALDPSVERVQGWLGVKTVPAGKGGVAAGLLVLSVAAGSPADMAGLRPTDILETVGDHALSSPADLSAALAGRIAGSTVRIRFRRRACWAECVVEVRAKRRRVRAD